MSELIKDIKYFWSRKCFAIGIPLMMALSYCTLLLNPTVGIDDTAFKVYFVDGVSPATGRWCLYLINKLLPLDYNPYFVEALGLVFFCLSVTLWCVVFYRILGEGLSVWAYTIAAAAMLSSPMISEVAVWYLQNGLFLGYGACAAAVLMGMESLRAGGRLSFKKRFFRIFLCAVFAAVAAGFYESFMLVFLMGMVMAFWLVRVTDCREYEKKPLSWILNVLGACVLGMLLRAAVTGFLTAAFHLEEQKHVLKDRGLSEILEGILSWFSPQGREELVYVLKDFFVKYYLNAVVYLPVMVLVLSVLVVLFFSIRYAAGKRDGWVLAAGAGIILLPWVLPVMERVATYYRSSQYVPLITAFAVLLIAWEIRNVKRLPVRAAASLAAFVLLYRQSYEMNQWFYVDAMKYEDTKRTMENVALYLQANCDTSKPVCVIGSYQTPESLISQAYCPEWSKKYTLIKFLVEGLSPELFETYNSPEGYAFAETPRLSFINWGATAFYGFDRELISFWSMHGFSFTEDGNLEHYAQARELMQDGPAWPKEGSVVELEEYIVVNFGNVETGE